jgi:DNA-binding transcriptional LysR family regulator
VNQLVAMRTFVEIVDRGSLTAAAEALERSLPTVVRLLSELEKHLGARLLQRTTRQMSLTEDGRNYLERCRRILADVEESERAVGRSQGEPRGIVRMTAPILFGQMHVAPLISRFLKCHRQVTIDLQLHDRVVNLVDEGFDLAVRIGRLADSSMIALPVGTIRRVVCASPKLLEETGVPQHPADLSSRPCVRFRGVTPGGAWTFEESGRPLQVSISSRLICNQAAAAAEACAEGLGFGLFLGYQVQPLVDAGRLQLVLENFEPAPLPVNLVYPEARLVSSRLRALLDWLKLHLRRDER